MAAADPLVNDETLTQQLERAVADVEAVAERLARVRAMREAKGRPALSREAGPLAERLAGVARLLALRMAEPAPRLDDLERDFSRLAGYSGGDEQQARSYAGAAGPSRHARPSPTQTPPDGGTLTTERNG